MILLEYSFSLSDLKNRLSTVSLDSYLAVRLSRLLLFTVSKVLVTLPITVISSRLFKALSY